MIYASTPPTASPHNTRGKYRAAGVGWGREHSPNPILMQLRVGSRDQFTVASFLIAIDAQLAFGGYSTWDSPGHPFHFMIHTTDDQAEHARRVLHRWVDIYGGR